MRPTSVPAQHSIGAFMGNQVEYHDFDGFAHIGELVEGVFHIYYEIDERTQHPRHWGFVNLSDGSRIFAHRNNRHHMSVFAVEKLHFVPRFYEVWPVERPFDEPKTGDPVVGVIGLDRAGRLCLISWSPASEYALALKECQNYLEHEQERLERDPNFRCIQRRIVAGKADFEWTLFEGTKRQFAERFDRGHLGKWTTKDPLCSTHIGSVTFNHNFVRETAQGWEPSDDPRTLRFQLTYSQAYQLLRFETTRRIEGPKWTHNVTGNMIASRIDGANIMFPETSRYLGTIFEGKSAERLMKVGAPDEYDKPAPRENTIPHASKYASSNLARGRRSNIGDQKTSHDLAELGRASSEWEQVGRDNED